MSPIWIKNNLFILLLLLWGGILSIGVANTPLFELDELYFAEITREMMVTGDYQKIQFGFTPLYEKPPLFFWIQAISMHVWGMNPWGARFPNLCCGLLTLALLYHIGKRYEGKRFALFWVSLYMIPCLPHLYFKSAIIDPFFNYFMLLALWMLANMSTCNKAMKAGFCMGMACLLKGPLGLFFPLISTIGAQTFRPLRQVRLFIRLALAIMVAVALTLIWLLPEIFNHGMDFIRYFGHYHGLLALRPEAHMHPWYYHFLVLLWGCFPASLFLFSGWRLPQYKNRPLWMHMQWLLFWVLVVYSSVGTKIVHYSSLAYFPIAFFGAHYLYQQHRLRGRVEPIIFRLTCLFSMVIASILWVAPLSMRYKNVWLPYIDDINIKSALLLDVHWGYLDLMPGVVYALGSIAVCFYLGRSCLISFIGVSMVVHMATITFFLVQFSPKIEQYAQGAMVEYANLAARRDIYYVPVGFKAAAPFFYGKKNIDQAQKEKNIDWLLQGPIDKPCIFVTYMSDRAFLEPYADISLKHEMGCFAFYERLPHDKTPLSTL